MSFETIVYEKFEGYGAITLNRPERMNALGKQMTAEIKQVIAEVSESNDINVLIITGAPRSNGKPCFSAGADLKDIIEKGYLPPLTVLKSLQGISTGERYGDGAFWEIVQRCPKITIAAIDGICSAGGLELALVCDIILASETAQIGDLHMKNMGAIGGAAVTVNLARRSGVSKAIELVSTSSFIDGKEAHRIHLANQVYPSEKLMEEAKGLAQKIAGMNPDGIMMVKAASNSIYDMNYRMSWRFADACSALLMEAASSKGKYGVK